MKNHIFILTAALMAVAVMAVPAKAQDCNFYLHAWDNDAFPNQVGVTGLTFSITLYNAEWEVLDVLLFNPGGGGLYWRVLTPQQMAGAGYLSGVF